MLDRAFAPRSPLAEHSPYEKTRSFSRRLFLLAVFCMPQQLELDAFKSVSETRFAPGDILLVLSVLAAPGVLRLRREPVSLLPLFMVGTLAYGLIVTLFRAGEVTAWAINVKLFGALLLGVWFFVTAHHVSEGWGPKIIRVWLIGMAVNGAIAYVDWKWFDVLPFLDAKIDPRFGGMQYDPNNAGAAYAVALVVHWRYGHRVFRSSAVRGSLSVLFLLLLVFTRSRGGLIAFGIAALAIFAATHISVAKLSRFAFIAFAALLIGASSGILGDTLSDWERRPDTVAAREGQIDEALRWFPESNGLGLGLGESRERRGKITHNTAVWLTSEMSAVGLAMFAVAVALPIHAALRRKRDDDDLAMAVLGANVAMVVASLGIEALYQRQWWLFIALCIPPTMSSRTAASAPPTVELRSG
ncbi:MAG: hypothetical protein RIB98_19495 [Acidimicrobiales bacterium]